MGNQTRELRREGHQKGLFTLIEPTLVALLNHQHTQRLSLMNNRNTQKGIKFILADFGDVLVARMFCDHFYIERLSPLGNIADKALPRTQTHFTHHRLVQTPSCSKNVTPSLLIQQVHAAHLSGHN